MNSAIAAVYEKIDEHQRGLDEIRAMLRKIEVGGPEELISPEELAKRLGCSTSAIYEQSRDGKIPSFKIGSSLRFSWNEIKEATRR